MSARPDDSPAPRAARPRTTSEERILRAARELFLADRYAGVSLERVAERAGVCRQTVYNRFGSKEAVFRAVVRAHWSAFAAQDHAPAVADRAGSAEEVLRAFAASLRRFAEETDQIRFARLVVAESTRLPWIAEVFHRLGREPVVAAFAERLDTLVRTGRLRCANTRLAARQFVGMVQEFLVWPRVMGLAEEQADLPDPEVVIDEAVRTFLARYAPAGA